MSFRHARFFLLVIILVTMAGNQLQAAIRTWDDGDPNNSFWSFDLNWDPDDVPLAADDAIVGGSPIVNTATIFNNLTNSGTIQINTGTLQPKGPMLVNDGTINVGDGSAIHSQLITGNGTTISGSGTVMLNRENVLNNGARIAGNFTHGADHTIVGVGNIQATILNEGMIVAEPRVGNRLDVTFSTITNTNLLQANSGAVLHLMLGSVIQEGAGRIRAADGGIIQLSGNNIFGGKLQTEGTGVIQVLTGQPILEDVTNEGVFEHLINSFTRLQGTSFINDGLYTVNQIGAVGVADDLTIGGAGTIVLSFSGSSSRLIYNDHTVTHAAGHTIRGQGLITHSIFDRGRFINHGRLEGISASQPLLIQGTLSGDGVMKDVTFGGGYQHILSEVETTGIVPLEGAFTYGQGSTVLMDLAGTTPGSGYDQLNSTGTITIDATQTRLEVSLADGFKPSVGDSFTLLTATGSINGSFATRVLPPLPLGLFWNESVTDNSYTISLDGNLAADFDEDGDVDDADLALWETGYGIDGSAVHMDGDADEDLDVDGSDFLVWQLQFGLGVTPLATALSAVPEPRAAMLAMLCGLALVGWYRDNGCLRDQHERRRETAACEYR